MSGPIAFAVPAHNLKLPGWISVVYKNGQENSRLRFGVGILCALLLTCCTHLKGLLDYRECFSLIASSIGYMVIICIFINSLFCNYFFLLLVWGFSFLCVNRFEDTEEKKNVKGEENAGTTRKGTGQRSGASSLVNAEKYIKSFRSFLYEEETLGTESEPIEDKIFKLKIASKALRKVQIIIDSLKLEILYPFHPPMNEPRRTQDLLDMFEHIKTYMALRLFILNMARRQLLEFTEKGMALKIWLSEAVEFHETLHSSPCSSHSDIQQHFALLLGIKKDSEVIQEKLAEYEHSTQSLTSTLQEISACSGIFHKAMEESSMQNGIRKWHDILTVSINEEATQVSQRFSTVTKLNECYQAHLSALHQRAFQQFKGVTAKEDAKSAVLSDFLEH